MAQAMASMSGLSGSAQAVLEGSIRLSGPSRLAKPTTSCFALAVVSHSGHLTLRAQQQQQQQQQALSDDSTAGAETGRRSVLGLVACGLGSGSFVQAVLAEAKPIPLGPPPPPSGGLPGTLNSDEARDLKLPYKNRFFLQPLAPAEAAKRAKESAKEIVNVKSLIDKKAWPYVQNDLRLRAEYLRYDLNTVISSKPKDEKKTLKDLTAKLFQDITNLDYAAKIKSTPEAEKYYAETVSTLNDVLSKLG